MQMCQRHWDALRAEVDKVGLGEFVARDGHEAVQRLKSAEGVDFEPLMGAHNKLVANAVDAAGLAVMTQPGCPLCYLIENCPCGRGDECRADFEKWPEKAAGFSLATMKLLKVVPPATERNGGGS